MGGRFLYRLPAFLRLRWRPEEARTKLARRLTRRETNFLALLKRAVFSNQAGPYRALFRRAGCEYMDVARQVAGDGLEETLYNLFKAGVYLTVDEFKGRQPAIRGGEQIRVAPHLLRNPSISSHLTLKSGGSRSRGTGVIFDLGFIAHCALDTALALHCRGGDNWLKANWEVPGGGALFSLLELSQSGVPPVRWFSQIDPRSEGLYFRYRSSGWVLHLGGMLANRKMPLPEHVGLDSPEPIALWMAECLKSSKTPYLLTYPSNALRVCRAAEEMGLTLKGAQFTIAGEPCTATRMEAIRSTGAAVLPKYGIMETGPVGYGCQNPVAPDDIHLLSDLHALIQPGVERTAADLPPKALLFTSLNPSAPLVMLNVSMGDEADMNPRDCGCKLHDLGWRIHLSGIKSFEKLTLGGMNFSDHDVVRVLDRVLPDRFGGGPTDYQVMEKEGPDGEPALKLLASPRLGEINPVELADAFIHGLSEGSQVNRVMALAWKEGRLLEVERREPLATASGKILHLHCESPK